MSSSTDNKELPKDGQFPASLLAHSAVWSYATNFIRGTEDFLGTKYQSDPWLSEFTDMPTTPHFSGTAFMSFTSSHERFMTDSTLTLQQLQRFGKDLRLRELVMVMLDLPPKLRDCFIHICAELIARDEDKDLSVTLIPAELAARRVEPYDPPASEKVHARHLEIANTIVSQKERENLQTSLARTSKFDMHSYRKFKEIIVQASKDWGEKIVGYVIRLFNLLMKTDQPKMAQLNALVERTGAEIDENPLQYIFGTLFLRYAQFVKGVGAFVGIVTGHSVSVPDESDNTTKVQLFFKELQKYGATKWEQFVPLFRKIQELNDTVESQKQMITALAYRHLIEHLPDQAYYKSTVPEKKRDKLNEKDYWKLVWDDMVSQELSHMIKGDFVPRDLTTLFEYSFKLWRRDHKTATSIPRENYIKWPNYERGEGLYGELSNNIHLYQGKQETAYNIHDSNWSRTDRTILHSLEPKTWPSTLASDVDWSAERKARGLPEK